MWGIRVGQTIVFQYIDEKTYPFTNYPYLITLSFVKYRITFSDPKMYFKQ